MARVLVADDDQDILEISKIILTGEGYDVLILQNGDKFREVVSDYKPDVILLDIRYGAYDGIDICNQLKSNPDTAGIPVILFSASHNLYSALENHCTPDDFVSKPFNIEELARKVRLNLDNRAIN